MNGRLDLTEAEAVVDLIDAETAAAARNAAAQLDGGLRRELGAGARSACWTSPPGFTPWWTTRTRTSRTSSPEEIARPCGTALHALDRLLDTCRRGRVLKSGVRTAIIGRPNAGKSFPAQRPGRL